MIQSVSFKAGAAAPPSYTITAVPPTSATVTAGSQATYALTFAEVGGFSSSVTPSCTGLPAGATCGFSPSPLTPGSATADTLTISTSASTPGGTSPITITGTPAPSQTAQVMLTVNAAPNFTLTANPTQRNHSHAGRICHYHDKPQCQRRFHWYCKPCVRRDRNWDACADLFAESEFDLR